MLLTTKKGRKGKPIRGLEPFPAPANCQMLRGERDQNRYRFRAFPMPKISVAFLKPGAILIPLEVYLVNSPSRSNLRPAAPLLLAERGSASRRNVARPAGMIIETRPPSVRRISLRFTAPHPVSSIALHRQGGVVHILPHPGHRPRFAVNLHPSSRQHQASIKAKTPVIVHDQGISRQTRKISEATKPAIGLSLWSAATCRRFELGDMSPSPKAQSCLRTPHGPRHASPFPPNQGKNRFNCA